MTLREAFADVAGAARARIRFQRMGISLLEDAGIVKVYLMPGRETDQFTEHILARPEYSDRLWPSPGGAPICIRDSTRELDLSYPIDRRVVDAGRRSVLAISLQAEGRQLGVLWFDSHHVDAFRDDDAIALGHVAHLLAVAIAHDRLWSLEQQRRIKRDTLESLLPMIAGALDVRTVFSQISDVIQDVIPHVTVSLALLTPDRMGVKVHVASAYDVDDLPEYRFTSESETISAHSRSFVAYDCTVVEKGIVRARVSPAGADEPAFVELGLGAPWTRILSTLKLRSLLRVPIRIGQETFGEVSFGSDKPFAYADDDVQLANRIADHVALALAHEREASLQERVEILVHELESRGAHREPLVQPSFNTFPPEGLTLEAVEHALLVKALAQSRNNKSQAAKLLGLPRGQLYSLLRRHGLTEARR